jgi:hypothetical protein
MTMTGGMAVLQGVSLPDYVMVLEPGYRSLISEKPPGVGGYCGIDHIRAPHLPSSLLP